MANPQRIALTASSIVVFGPFAWAVRSHFASPKMPFKMKLVSSASLAALAVFLWRVWAGAEPFPAYAVAIGLLLQSLGLALFIAAVRIVPA